MSTEFCTSQTKLNVMRAYAGETQSHLRYIFAKEQAKKQKQHVIAALFNFTAMQEKEHAEIFYNYLKQCSGEAIEITADYPVDDTDDLCKLLSSAVKNETHEANNVYPAFAEIARQEGFTQIAQHFENIAKIEQSHAERFDKFMQLMQSGKLFSSDQTERWICLNCGYILESTSAPEQCPVCSTEQSYYLRLEMASWGLS